jgi:predicted nucleotidyltransferase
MSDGVLQDLPLDVRETLRSYLTDVTALFGPSLEAIILYGSAARGEYLPGRSNINLLLLLAKHDVGALQRYGKEHRRWSKERIVVPLFLTEEELRSSASLFALEYFEIKEQHVLLAGRDPFPSLAIDLRNLLGQCEQEIRGNLLRLRQRFVEGAGNSEAAAILLPLSLTALLPCLRGLFRLLKIPIPRMTEALLENLQAGLGVDPVTFQDVLYLKRGLISPGPLEMPRFFERYVSSLQTLIERVEQLKAQGRF